MILQNTQAAIVELVLKSLMSIEMYQIASMAVSSAPSCRGQIWGSCSYPQANSFEPSEDQERVASNLTRHFSITQ